jgi:hypothetical protein
MKNPSQNSQCTGRDSKGAPLEYESRALPLDQWYSTFFDYVSPDIISLKFCTPKVVGAYQNSV